MNPKIAILIPCYNEEPTVGQVVRDFRKQLPGADIYVFDNNSSDRTVEVASDAGARIALEPRQGKGYVVQAMFREVDADIYVMVDGDDTYPPAEVHKLVAPVVAGEADMAVGSRFNSRSASQIRALNRMGNRFFLNTINFVFKVKLSDILSGYRVFSRKFVKNIPIFGGGFETEAELTIKALAHGYRIVELPVDLKARPEGSFSKIRIMQDGLLILNSILTLFREQVVDVLRNDRSVSDPDLPGSWGDSHRGVHKDGAGPSIALSGLSRGVGAFRAACGWHRPSYHCPAIPGVGPSTQNPGIRIRAEERRLDRTTG